jgi:hypothetical protein
MAVAVNLVPVTGVTLPLVSMGGSSVIFTSIAFGIILSVSRNIEEEKSVRNRMSDLRVIISGGGTGGHIFPAIAIANSYRETTSRLPKFFSLEPMEEWKWKKCRRRVMKFAD